MRRRTSLLGLPSLLNTATTPFAVFGLSMGACGAFDYARRDQHPAVAEFARGGHDADYWLRTVPEVVTWLAGRARG